MLQRLYVHNFRCFEHFEFKPQDQTAVLLLGKNASGKSTMRQVLALFQAIGRGRSRVGELITSSDFAQHRRDEPIWFELEVRLGRQSYAYSLVLELPERFRELRVQQERLVVDGEVIFNRDAAKVAMPRKTKGYEDAVFFIDWHLVALPIIQDAAAATVLRHLREWLGGMILLAPIPFNMRDEAIGSDAAIHESAHNLADWLADLLERFPAAYSSVVEHLQQFSPDLQGFRFDRLGRDARALLVLYREDQKTLELPISALADGEKCFFINSILLAANQMMAPLPAFWDEPENYLAPHEVNQFVIALKRSFLRHQSQLIISSHNPQAILCFAQDSTWVMGRRHHLEPSQIRCLEELNFSLPVTSMSPAGMRHQPLPCSPLSFHGHPLDYKERHRQPPWHGRTRDRRSRRPQIPGTAHRRLPLRSRWACRLPAPGILATAPIFLPSPRAGEGPGERGRRLGDLVVPQLAGRILPNRLLIKAQARRHPTDWGTTCFVSFLCCV